MDLCICLCSMTNFSPSGGKIYILPVMYLERH